MKARDLMTRPVITVRPETPTGEAAALLGKHQITALPVVDVDSRLLGMISEGDLLRNQIRRDGEAALREHESRVGALMTSPAVRVAESDDISDVAGLMLYSNVHSVPVVDAEEVVGIISRRDLVRTLVRTDDALAAEVRTRLDAYGGRPGRWDVDVQDGAVIINGDFDDHVEEQVARALARTVPGVRTVALNPDPVQGS
jgi:CBS domain-containing protein